MHITVVVVTWNRCELLRQTLEQLARVPVPPAITFDCIVVNNHCTDATDAVIDEFRGRLPVRRLFEATPGASNARNTALAAVTGEYVLMIDDDVLVDESWFVEFEAATRAFPQAAAFGGIIEPWFPHPPDPDLLQVFPSLKMGFCALDHNRAPGTLPDNLFVWSANMAIRMDALGDLRFNPDLGPSPTSFVCGEEVDLIRRLRAAHGSVVWWPTMRVRHYVAPHRMSLAYLLQFAAGKGTEQVLAAPVRPARLLFAAPRWLWRGYSLACVGYWLTFVTSTDIWPHPKPIFGRIDPQLPRHIRRLAWRRELAIFGGMLRGYQQLERRRRRGDAKGGPSCATDVIRSR